MMPIGDDQLLVGHGRAQQPDRRRIADAPQPVHHAVLVCHLGVGGAAAVVENLLHAARWVRVQHEDLAEMRVRRLQQVQPITFRLGQRLLMTEDYLLGIIMKLAQRDESAALLHLARCPAP